MLEFEKESINVSINRADYSINKVKKGRTKKNFIHYLNLTSLPRGYILTNLSRNVYFCLNNKKDRPEFCKILLQHLNTVNPHLKIDHTFRLSTLLKFLLCYHRSIYGFVTRKMFIYYCTSGSGIQLKF